MIMVATVHSSLSPWHFALVAVLSLLCDPVWAEPAPMVVDPSQYWEGNDGPWSTFSLQVGDSKNITRVLVSTAIPNQWVVLQEACTSTSCADSRGGNLFDYNKSSTWDAIGRFNLYYESNLNYTGNGEYGNDTVGIGLNPSDASTVQDTVVVGIVANDFWYGYLGVNPQSTNISDFKSPIPSLIQSLKDKGSIPSLSYSYTAGAQYRNKGAYGQLILGGYDTSRFQPNAINFNMAGDITRDLVVGIQSLQAQESTGKTTNILNGGILAYVDSTVPWFVLPSDACDTIEETFGISQDEETGLYLISDSQHSALSSRNPNFTFFLGNDQSSGNTVPITIPYSAFDLQVKAPYVNGSSRYFPLKRGNDTNYTLGRAFLQEVYLTANYERQNFSISQAFFPQTAQPSIQPIHAVGYTPPDSSNGSSSATSARGIPIGALVGIVIAVVIILIACATLLILRHQRRWPFHKRQPSGAIELDGDGNPVAYEKDGTIMMGRGNPSNWKPQLHGQANSKDDTHGYCRPELAENAVFKSELSGSAISRNELPGTHAATEVEGSPGIAMELAGSPVSDEFYRRRDGKGSESRISNANLSTRSTLTPRSLPANTPSGFLSTDSAGRSPVSPQPPSGDGSQYTDQSSPSRGLRTPITPLSPPSPRRQYNEHSSQRQYR